VRKVEERLRLSELIWAYNVSRFRVKRGIRLKSGKRTRGQRWPETERILDRLFGLASEGRRAANRWSPVGLDLGAEGPEQVASVS
jgi:hypothetical protein